LPVISVAISPGATAFTVMPLAASCWASTLVSSPRPSLAAKYAPGRTLGACSWTLAMLMIRPPRPAATDDRKLMDQLGGQPAAGLADDVTRSDGVEQSTGLLGGHVFLRAAGHQLEQQVLQAGEYLGAGPAELVTAIHQQPQRHRGVIHLNLPQARGAQGDHGDAEGVDRIGLSALASGEHPR
jgi:hypothetical protein